MLATHQYSKPNLKSRTYENLWRDNHKFQIPWLNFLTAQPIPEETDVNECSKRIRTVSLASSSSSISSIEDYYIVLDVQRPNSINQQLNFAQIIDDGEHRIEYEQCVQLNKIEIPSKSYAIEYQLDELIEPVKVTQLVIHSPRYPKKSILLSNNNPSNILKQSVHNHYPITSSEEKSIFTRTFAFDHTCIEKFDHVKQEKIKYVDTCPTDEQALTHSYYIDPNDSKPPTLLRLIKKRSRIINSEYYLSLDEIKVDEPKLLQVKYYDGRPALINSNESSSIENSQLFKTSISSRLSSSKYSVTQELSYRKRILNYVQSFFMKK